MAGAGQAPWPYNWVPQPNEFATLFNTIATALATAGPTLVGTATTNIYVGIPRSKTFYVAGANMTGAIAAAGSGAITAQLMKNASTALTAAYDLTAATSGNNVDVPITAADPDRVLVPGDVLWWKVAAAGTITTSPDLRAVVELSLMK